LKHVDDDTQWRGQRDTSRRRLWTLVAVSVLAHVPLTPLAGLFGLLAFLATPTELPPGEPLPPINAIPVDLLEGDEAPPPSQDKPAEPKPQKADPPKDKDPEAPKAELEPDQTKKPAGEEENKASKGIGDPTSMAGAAGKVTDSNANVRLLIFADRIRKHPLGTRIGELLADADQWKDFFGAGGVDPINDIDRILIAGPQLRESADVVAVLRHNADPASVRGAIDALVKRDPEGKWVDGPVPAAYARADRAERVFVIASPKIIVVTPPSAADHAVKVGPSLRFPNPKGGEALTTYVATPWRAFIGVPFPVPQTIRWVRMKITATPDGGAVAELVAKDGSEELAKENAVKLTSDINRVTQINTGVLGGLIGMKTFRVIEPVSFTSQGDEIHGTVTATPRQLGALLEAISKLAKDIAAKNAAKAKAKAAAAAAAAADGGAKAPAPADAGAARSQPATPDPTEPNRPEPDRTEPPPNEP
jgi:hypothetical protein